MGHLRPILEHIVGGGGCCAAAAGGAASALHLVYSVRWLLVVGVVGGMTADVFFLTDCCLFFVSFVVVFCRYGEQRGLTPIVLSTMVGLILLSPTMGWVGGCFLLLQDKLSSPTLQYVSSLPVGFNFYH